jgi:hypothetical protein
LPSRHDQGGVALVERSYERAVHTVNEWVDLGDIEATTALLIETLRLNAEA